MNLLTANIIALLVIVAPTGVALLCFDIAARKHKDKLNPLTKNMRRPAGTELGKTLGGLQLEVGFLYSMIMTLFLYPWAYYGLMNLLGMPVSIWQLLLPIGICLVAAVVIGRKLIKTYHDIKKYRLAYECELAVGQELDRLMLQGFLVFHDIQADKFNIDHVVVGKGGVFAVETKGRSKKANSRGNGKAEYVVNYENGTLKFPGWNETAPINQADLQAKWLGKELSNATGFNVMVAGVVVLPGWFINGDKSQKISVIAGGYIPTYFPQTVLQKLNDNEIKQIVYQLEQKVRDLAPGEVTKPLEL